MDAKPVSVKYSYVHDAVEQFDEPSLRSVIGEAARSLRRPRDKANEFTPIEEIPNLGSTTINELLRDPIARSEPRSGPEQSKHEIPERVKKAT